MSKKKIEWYRRDKVTVQMVYYHSNLRDDKKWQFLEKMTEDELIALGQNPLWQIRKAWVEKRDACEMNRVHCMCSIKRAEKVNYDEKGYLAKLNASVSTTAEMINGCNRVLAFIDGLITRAEIKPIIPQLRERNFEWCQPNLPDWTRVHCEEYHRRVAICIPRDWLAPTEAVLKEEGKIVTGTVDSIWRREGRIDTETKLDRPVAFIADQCWEMKDGVSNPIMIGLWEYEYLKSHPDFCRIWLDLLASIPQPSGIYPYACDAWREEFGIE